MSQTIRPQDIVTANSLETKEAAWKAVGALFESFTALLAKLDADGALNDSDYAATLGLTNTIQSK